MFGTKSMDDMPKIGMGSGSDDDATDTAPVTRAEFEALKSQVADIQTKVDDYDEDEKSEGDDEDDKSDDSVGSNMASASISGASKSSKPSPAAKKMVSTMNPLKSKPGSKPPFSY